MANPEEGRNILNKVLFQACNLCDIRAVLVQGEVRKLELERDKSALMLSLALLIPKMNLFVFFHAHNAYANVNHRALLTQTVLRH